MTTWQEDLRDLAKSLWKTRRAPSLSFGDTSISRKDAYFIRNLVGSIAPSLILDDDLDLGKGNPYPDEDFHLFVRDSKVSGAWIRGYVWSKYTSMREDPDGEIGVEINLNIFHMTKDGQGFAEQYVMSCWGDDEKPRLSAGAFVNHFAETGYEGSHLGTKVISVPNAKLFIEGVKLVLEGNSQQ
jgi:hypothetical protein